MHTDLPSLCTDDHGALLRYLRVSFPNTPLESLQDAIQDSLLDVLERPSAFERALSTGGPARLRGLLRCVAWRKTRGAVTRGAGRFERGGLPLTERAHPPGQELASDVGARTRRLVDEAVDRFGGDRPDQLRAALIFRFMTGGSDTSVAAAFGLRREALNRAKRHVQAGLLE